MLRLLRRLIKKQNRLRYKDGTFRKRSIYDDPLVIARLKFEGKTTIRG